MFLVENWEAHLDICEASWSWSIVVYKHWQELLNVMSSTVINNHHIVTEGPIVWSLVGWLPMVRWSINIIYINRWPIVTIIYITRWAPSTVFSHFPTCPPQPHQVGTEVNRNNSSYFLKSNSNIKACQSLSVLVLTFLACFNLEPTFVLPSCQK